MQDWALLYVVNSTYVDLIYNTSCHLITVYLSTTKLPFPVLDTIWRLLGAIENALGTSGGEDLLSELVTRAAQLLAVYRNLTVYSDEHYLYNYINDSERRGEELNVRLASDMQLMSNHTIDYASMVRNAMNQSHWLQQDLTATWWEFLATLNQTVYPVNQWNQTMVGCLTRLTHLRAESLTELEQATVKFIRQLMQLKLDPRVDNKAVTNVEISEVDFFM